MAIGCKLEPAKAGLGWNNLLISCNALQQILAFASSADTIKREAFCMMDNIESLRRYIQEARNLNLPVGLFVNSRRIQFHTEFICVMAL